MTSSLEKARSLLAAATGLSPSAIGDDASLETLAEWDSIAHVNILLAIEAETGQMLTPDEIWSVSSLKSVARYFVPSVDRNPADGR